MGEQGETAHGETATLAGVLAEPPVAGGIRAKKMTAKASGELLGVYGVILTIIAGRVGHDPSEDEIAGVAPWVLFKGFGTTDEVTKFVLALCDATEEQVGDLDLDGFVALWQAVYGANQCPFVMLHADAASLIQEALAPTPEPTPTSPTPSEEPASISETTT
jgi:hypothetical protein